MKTFTLWILLFSLFSFFGCSLKGTSDATLKITLGAQVDMTQFPGGVVLWGKTTDGLHEFGEVLPPDNNGEISAELPNGTWNFYVVGWQGVGIYLGDMVTLATDGPAGGSCSTGELGNYYYIVTTGTYPLGQSLTAGNYLECDGSSWVENANLTYSVAGPMIGNVKCASSLGNTLTGGQIDVDLTMSNAGCASGIFAPATLMNGTGTLADPFKFPEFKYIANCKNVSTVGDSYNAWPCMDTPLRGFAKSIKVKIPSFRKGAAGDRFPIIGQPMEVCLSASNYADGTFYDFNGLNIPLGNMDAPLKVDVEMYYDIDCNESTRPKFTFMLDKGLLAPNGVDIFPGIRSFTGSDGSKNIVELFTATPSEHFCSGFPLTAGLIGIGDGSMMSSPLGVCTPEQLNNASVLAATSSASHFVLLRDLDMTPYIKALGTYTPPYDSGDCHGPGNNFMPIGASFDATCTYSKVAFNGSFDGLGHRIKNLWFEGDEADGVGLVAQAGTGFMGVYNLILEAPQFSGNTYVGAILGQGSTATGSIKNIHIFNGDVDGRSGMIGGIAGDAGSAAIADNHLFYSTVRGGGTYFAGVAGLSNASISNTSFHGQVLADRDPSSANSVAGIIGGGTGSATLSLFEGVIACPAYTCTNVGFIDIADGYDNTISASGNHATGVKMYGDGSSNIITASTSMQLDYANYPPFSWETDLRMKYPNYQECIDIKNQMSIIDQINNEGRGTATNPINLCNEAQFWDMKNYPDKVYSVKGSIKLSQITTGGMDNRIPSFSGTILGNGRMIYNIDLLRNSVDASYLSLFQSFVGVMADLNFMGVTAAAGGSAGGSVAPIVGVNNGTLKGVEVGFINVSTDQQNGIIAGVVGENNGVIDGLGASGMVSKFDTNNNGGDIIAGVVGKNSGTVSHVRSQVAISAIGNAAIETDTVGGVIGENSNFVSQVVFKGQEIYLDSTNGYAGTYGGIVARNLNGGKVQDSQVSSEVKYNVAVEDGAVLSSVVGDNQSGASIDRVFNGSILTYVDISQSPFEVGELAALNTGAINSNSFYINPSSRNLGAVTDDYVDLTCANDVININFAAAIGIDLAAGDLVMIEDDQVRGMTFEVANGVPNTSSIVPIRVPCTYAATLNTFGSSESVNFYRPNYIYNWGTTSSINTCSSNVLSISLATTPGFNMLAGDKVRIMGGGLEGMLFTLSAPVASMDTSISINIDCVGLATEIGSLSAIENITYYKSSGSIINPPERLDVESLSDIGTYSAVGWSILEEIDGQPIPLPIIDAHLNNDPSLGPVWILESHDGAPKPSLFWENFR